MAIPKPTDIPRWADTDPTKRVQPSTAKANVGWDPEEKPPAQYENWLLYTIYKWCEWLNDITNQSLVWAAAHSFNEGLTASRTTPNTNAITTIGNGSGAGVFARGGSSGVGVRGEGFGASAPGIDGYGDTSGGAGGAGVRGTGGSGSAGVLGTGNAAGAGVSGTGGGTGGAGVAGTGGAGSGPGVFGIGGMPNGNGASGTGTGTGTGIQGAGGASNGYGVRGVGGATNGVGLRGEGTGTGAGVSAVGGLTDGHGIVSQGIQGGNGIVSTGGSNNGVGVRGIGGGTDSDGAQGFGAGNRPGIYGEGGGSSGYGVLGKGGTPNGTGVRAEATGSGLAISAAGDIQTTDHIILGASDTGTATPTPNVVETFCGRDSIIYGWAKVSSAGVLGRGKNINNIARPATGHYVITMNASLSDDANASVWAMPETQDISVSVLTSTVMTKLQVDIYFRTIGVTPVDVDTAFRFGLVGT